MWKEIQRWFWLMVPIILSALMMLYILYHRIPPLVEGCSLIAANSEGAENVVMRCVSQQVGFSEGIFPSECLSVKEVSHGYARIGSGCGRT
jgi:hypothetical protein